MATNSLTIPPDTNRNATNNNAGADIATMDSTHEAEPPATILAAVARWLMRSGVEEISSRTLWEHLQDAQQSYDGHSVAVALAARGILTPAPDQPAIGVTHWRLPIPLRDRTLPDRISATLWLERVQQEAQGNEKPPAAGER